MKAVLRRVPLRESLRWVLCGAVWGYSGLHFFLSGVRLALGNAYGDFLANFPSSTLADWINPGFFHGSVAEAWTPRPLWGYGPVMHLVTFPLLFLPSLRSAYVVWLFVNYVFLAVACWLLYRLAFPGPRSLTSATLFVFVVLNYYPLYEALVQRNIEIFELMLLVVGMTLYARSRDRIAGGVVGLAAMTKFLPAIFVPYFAVKGRWRAAWSALAVIGAFGVFAQVVFGWQHNWVLIQLRQGTYLETQLNQALSGPVLRLARAAGFAEYGILASRVVALVLGAALVWLMWRFRHDGHWKIDWCLLLVAMIMLPPHNQNYYLVFLLVPYTVLLGMIACAQIRRRSTIALTWMSFLLTGWPIPLSILNRTLGGDIAARLLQLSVPVLGTGFLVVVLVGTLSATGASTSASCSGRSSSS